MSLVKSVDINHGRAIFNFSEHGGTKHHGEGDVTEVYISLSGPVLLVYKNLESMKEEVKRILLDETDSSVKESDIEVEYHVRISPVTSNSTTITLIAAIKQ